VKMPGFNAEVSLCHASGRYQSVPSWIEGTGGHGATPQQDIIPPHSRGVLFPL